MANDLIIFVKDFLDEYYEDFVKVFNSKKVLETNYDKMEDYILNLSQNIQKGILIIICSGKLEEKGILEYIDDIFGNKLKIQRPALLFITEENIPIEKAKQYKNNNIYFQYSNQILRSSIKHYLINLKQYVTLIINEIINNQRLNEYIIDSFETIIDIEKINQQKKIIEDLNKELEILSTTDSLTQLLNRRAFFNFLFQEKKRTDRDLWRLKNTKKIHLEKSNLLDEEYGKNPAGGFLDHYGKFSLIMLDLDHFKKINDKYGHIVGDKVLKELGELLRTANIFRENDIIGRYGGEEFTIILPETNYQHAKIPAERLRREFKKIDFLSESKETFHVTISLGISEYRIQDIECDEIVKRADKALYYAKNHGRDQIAVYEEMFPNDDLANSSKD